MRPSRRQAAALVALLFAITVGPALPAEAAAVPSRVGRVAEARTSEARACHHTGWRAVQLPRARRSIAIGVSNSPGKIAFTRTPSAATSMARSCVIALIPALAVL